MTASSRVGSHSGRRSRAAAASADEGVMAGGLAEAEAGDVRGQEGLQLVGVYHVQLRVDIVGL